MPFPSTGKLTEFDPPAENPLSEGGTWQQLTPERSPLRKTGANTVTNTTFGFPDYSVYVKEAFFGNAEVWACPIDGQLGAALETWRISIWTEIGVDVKGYQLYHGGALSKDLVLRKYTGGIGSFTGIGGLGGVGYPDGMGLKINGNEVEAWTEVAGVWSLIFSVTDTPGTGPFYLGLGLEDPTTGGLSFSCFGGGTRKRSQFFRWLYN